MEDTETRERWEARRAQCRQTIRETAALFERQPVDLEGLLILADWLSNAAEDLPDGEARELGACYAIPNDIAPEAIRLVLKEALYDELWGILRSGGWLETP